MKKRSLKKYFTGGLTNLQQNVKGTNPDAEVVGEGLGTSIGTGAGLALNAVVPGLGFVAAPILGKLGGMAGKAIGDKFDNSDDIFEANQKKINDSFNQYNQGNQTYSLQSNVGRGLAFAEGGIIPEPNAELELNEQFQLPDGQVGQVDGASHENGGVPIALPENTRVFSDRLKHNGKTFAKIVKPINNRINKLEDKPNVSQQVKDNTKMLLDQQLDHFFNIQETNKQNTEMKRSLKMTKGGIVKYANGGKTPWEDLNNPLQTMVTNPDGTVQYPIKTNQVKTPYTINSKRGMSEVSSPIIPSLESVNTTIGYRTPPENNSTWLEDNAGQIGQVGTALATTALQARNLNKLARPRTLAKLRLSDKITNPNLVDYSSQRADIDRAALAEMDAATRGLSNSATAAAFRNQANLRRLRGTGASRQEESNVNAQIKNQFLGQLNQAKMQEEMVNNDIDKYNLENQYNFDAFKTGQKGEIIGQVGNTVGQVFGNQTKYKNQLDQAEILSHQYDPTVYRDANGNVIKKKFSFGGKVRKLNMKKAC